MLKSKRCPKCGTQATYKNIIELYEVRDLYAVWTCSRCGNQEKIDNGELIIRCRAKSQATSYRT